MRGKNEKKTYLKIAMGKIRERSDSSNPNAVKREYKDNDDNIKVVYEIVDDWVEGYIKDLNIHNTDEYGSFYNLHIEDGEDRFVLQFKCESSVANSIIVKLPNVDLNKKVKIIPYYFEEEGRTKTPVVLMQGGEKVENYWTKENPGNLTPFPDTDGMDERKRKRVIKMAMTERLEEMEQYVLENVFNNIPDTNTEIKPQDVEVPNNADEDLPF
jgi:hypothetical protein